MRKEILLQIRGAQIIIIDSKYNNKDSKKANKNNECLNESRDRNLCNQKIFICH